MCFMLHPTCLPARPPACAVAGCRSGAAQYENGGVYVGEFRGDHRSGWGTHYFPGKDKYEGEWADDRMTGEGAAGAGGGCGWVAGRGGGGGP